MTETRVLAKMSALLKIVSKFTLICMPPAFTKFNCIIGTIAV